MLENGADVNSRNYCGQVCISMFFSPLDLFVLGASKMEDFWVFFFPINLGYPPIFVLDGVLRDCEQDFKDTQVFSFNFLSAQNLTATFFFFLGNYTEMNVPFTCLFLFMHMKTAVMQACRYGHWEVVQTLLIFRCNVSC